MLPICISYDIIKTAIIATAIATTNLSADNTRLSGGQYMEWDKINSEVFEQLCFDYAKTEYSQFRWESTPKSWDGNKDGEFQIEINRLNRILKGWYEAKYTYDANNAIPKAHMDSTLVSGILDGDVVYILFITDGRITNEFRRRAYALLRPHKIDVNFVDGEILERWLERHPKIHEKYFGKINGVLIKNKVIRIEDACFFDAVFSSPSFISPLKALTVSNDYFLYLGIKTSENITFDLNESSESLQILEKRRYTVSPGYNSLLIRCHTKKELTKRKIDIALVSAEDNREMCKRTLELSVKPTFNPRIVCFSQDKTLHDMYDYLSFSEQRNRALAISARGGMGKSHLIFNLMSSINLQDAMVMFGGFTEKDAENASLLCRLIMFLNFGTLYELSETAFLEFAARQVQVPISLLIALKNGTHNQISAIEAIKKFSKYVFRDNGISCYISGCSDMLFTHPSYIVIEDCHKLSSRYADLFSHIIQEYMTKKRYQTLIVSYRPHEFNHHALEKALMSSIYTRYDLNPVTRNDVSETMLLNFGEQIQRITKTFPLPQSLLHLVFIVKEIERIRSKNTADILIDQDIMNVYRKINDFDNGYIIEKIKSCTSLSILSLIYQVEIGIPSEVLSAYLKDRSTYIIDSLLKTSLVRIEAGLIKPYHDVYIAAYNIVRAQLEYVSETSNFLAFCVQAQFDTDIIESLLISALLDNKKSVSDDRKLLHNKCVAYYQQSNYDAAAILAKRLLDERNEGISDYEVDIHYIYAQSIKATQSHYTSTIEFKELEQRITDNATSSHQIGILYDCISEVVNNDLWTFQFIELEEYLNRLKRLCVSKKSSPNEINAFLNYHNRSMMFYAMTGDYAKCKEFYKSSIKQSLLLGKNNYFAYALMDYAKTVYVSKIYLAKKLLEKAYPVFLSSEEYHRRELECKAEIVFLNHILNNLPYDCLYVILKEMLRKKYVHAYFKTYIKILFIEFINQRDADLVSSRLNSLLLMVPESASEARGQLYVYQLQHMLSFFSATDLQSLRKLEDKYEKHIEVLGPDYADTLRHNQRIRRSNSTNIVWYHKDIAQNEQYINSYWLDPRIW